MDHSSISLIGDIIVEGQRWLQGPAYGKMVSQHNNLSHRLEKNEAGMSKTAFSNHTSTVVCVKVSRVLSCLCMVKWLVNPDSTSSLYGRNLCHIAD